MVISFRLANASEESFPDATSFNPDRFVLEAVALPLEAVQLAVY